MPQNISNKNRQHVKLTYNHRITDWLTFDTTDDICKTLKASNIPIESGLILVAVSTLWFQTIIRICIVITLTFHLNFNNGFSLLKLCMSWFAITHFSLPWMFPPWTFLLEHWIELDAMELICIFVSNVYCQLGYFTHGFQALKSIVPEVLGALN